jgi:hypothetical protein
MPRQTLGWSTLGNDPRKGGASIARAVPDPGSSALLGPSCISLQHKGRRKRRRPEVSTSEPARRRATGVRSPTLHPLSRPNSAICCEITRWQLRYSTCAPRATSIDSTWSMLRGVNAKNLTRLVHVPQKTIKIIIAPSEPVAQGAYLQLASAGVENLYWLAGGAAASGAEHPASHPPMHTMAARPLHVPKVRKPRGGAAKSGGCGG